MFAVTGIVHDTRRGHDEPLQGATVTYSSVQGPGLATPPGGSVSVTTTGYGGAFAFIDVPVASGGSCYRMVIVAPGAGRYESMDVIDSGVYDDSGLELDGRSYREPYPVQTRGTQMPNLDRACAAQASRWHASGALSSPTRQSLRTRLDRGRGAGVPPFSISVRQA